MEDYQKRVVEEQKELNKKLDKLTVFVEESEVYPLLDKDERDRLLSQLAYMEGYNAVLLERINVFS